MKSYWDLLPFFFIAFVSCNSDSKKADIILQSVEDIVEQYPDSVFLIATLILFVVAFLFYRKKKRDEKMILLAKQEIFQLKEIISNSVHSEENPAKYKKETTEANKKMRETLGRHFDIFKRIA